MDEELKQLIVDSATETRQQFDEVRRQFDEVRQEIGALRQEIKDSTAEVRQELRQEIKDSATELRLHFDITTEHFQHEIKLLAEGIANTNERIDLLTEEMRDRFAETHAELRLVTEGVAQLNARVAQLEIKVSQQGDDMKRGFSETILMIAALRADHRSLSARLDQLENPH